GRQDTDRTFYCRSRIPCRGNPLSTEGLNTAHAELLWRIRNDLPDLLTKAKRSNFIPYSSANLRMPFPLAASGTSARRFHLIFPYRHRASRSTGTTFPSPNARFHRDLSTTTENVWIGIELSSDSGRSSHPRNL